MDCKNILLDVKDLTVSFDTYAGEVQAVRGISFYLEKGEAIAIVGESGCGKSVTAQSIMRLIPAPPSRVKKGSVEFNGKDLLKISEREMQTIRGSEIGMIFQDPMTSLNPTMTVGNQICESLVKHRKIKKSVAWEEALKMLKLVNIPNAEKRLKQYPHEFSGGMRQRAMIAIALSCNPKLLIADEPTTALDVTIQAQIIDLMQDLQKDLNTAIILITHDLGVVADMAQRVIVMYAGKIVEYGSINEIFYQPEHPYTWGLLKSVPRLDTNQKGELFPIEGTPPDLFAPPIGCGFAARCEWCMQVCKDKQPEFFQVSEGHMSACWLLHPEAPEVTTHIYDGGAK